MRSRAVSRVKRVTSYAKAPAFTQILQTGNSSSRYVWAQARGSPIRASAQHQEGGDRPRHRNSRRNLWRKQTGLPRLTFRRSVVKLRDCRTVDLRSSDNSFQPPNWFRVQRRACSLLMALVFSFSPMFAFMVAFSTISIVLWYVLLSTGYGMPSLPPCAKLYLAGSFHEGAVP